MLYIPHCARCGYANAPTWPRCYCCGRRMCTCAKPARTKRPRPARTRRAHRRRPTRILRSKLGAWRRNSTSKVPGRPEVEDLAEIIAAW